MKYVVLLSSLLFFLGIFSQKVSVSYLFTAPSEAVSSSFFKKPHTLASRQFLAMELMQASLYLTELGYYTATLDVDSLSDSPNITVKVFPGEQFKGVQLTLSPELVPWFEQFARSSVRAADAIVFKSPSAYASALQQVIRTFQNNGYPFATYNFDSLGYSKGWISLNVSLIKGRRMQWKEIIIKGDSSIALKPIQQIIGIRSGDLFSMDKLKDVDDRIEQLTFVDAIKPSDFVFSKDGMTLFLYLKATKSSNVNGVLGLQPNPVSQKIGLTGELQLKLNNALRRAEQLDFNWRSIKPATQLLNLRLLYPYLFNSLLGTEVKLNLYKRDSTFLELKSTLGIQYQVGRNWQLKGMFSYFGSNRLYAANSSAEFLNVTSLKNSMYGLGINYKKLDYLPNPRAGLAFQLEGFIGQRSVLNDSSGKVVNAKVSMNLEHFIPIHKRWVIRYQLSFDTYLAPSIFSNECYRFGGLNTQRGFNEEQFLATTKSVNQVELRYLLDRNSAVFAFFDQSIYENRSNNSYQKDAPMGFGVGANIGSTVGIFSLAYALGLEKNNPFDARSGKIHFGYIAYF
jgi:outer membrane protein assembly factor BamA